MLSRHQVVVDDKRALAGRLSSLIPRIVACIQADQRLQWANGLLFSANHLNSGVLSGYAGRPTTDGYATYAAIRQTLPVI